MRSNDIHPRFSSSQQTNRERLRQSVDCAPTVLFVPSYCFFNPNIRFDERHPKSSGVSKEPLRNAKYSALAAKYRSYEGCFQDPHLRRPQTSDRRDWRTTLQAMFQNRRPPQFWSVGRSWRRNRLVVGADTKVTLRRTLSVRRKKHPQRARVPLNWG